MKTDIDLAKLVDAYRAKEQERLDGERAKAAAQVAEISAGGERALALLWDIWPKFEFLFKQLPPAQIHGHTEGFHKIVQVVPSIETDHPSAYGKFVVQGYHKFGVFDTPKAYPADIVIGVRCDAGKSPIYWLKNGYLYAGQLQGIADMRAENPADILIKLAELVGTSQAK